MHPTLFKYKLPHLFGNSTITIYTYAFLIVLGAIIAAQLITRFSKKQLNHSVPYSFFYKAFAAGFVGGKLFCFLENPILYVNNYDAAMQLLKSGFVCYGSVIFITAYVIYYANKNKISVYGFLDIVATACVVTQVLGRLGCFFAGCCYGKTASVNLGVVFPNITSTAVHPTQLYEALLMSVVFALLLFFNKHKKQNGQAFLFYIIAYATIRFTLEFTRGDSRGFFFNGLLSHSQTISIAILIASIIILIKQKINNLKQQL